MISYEYTQLTTIAKYYSLSGFKKHACTRLTFVLLPCTGVTLLIMTNYKYTRSYTLSAIRKYVECYGNTTLTLNVTINNTTIILLIRNTVSIILL